MPVARIRTYDPEAVAFLATQLAGQGYQLQFASPEDTGLPEVDLELTVTRATVEEALREAHAQAVELNADVTVLPGLFENVPELRVTQSAAPAAPIQAPIEEVTEDMPPAPTPGPSRVDIAMEAAGRTIGAGITGLSALSDATGKQIADWKRQYAESQQARRVEQERRQIEAMEREHQMESLPRRAEQRRAKVPVRAKARVTQRSNSLPGRKLRLAVMTTAIVAAAFVVGWNLAGSSRPADPVGRSALNRSANVQEQTPFGPASISAPAVKPATTAVRPKPPAAKAKPSPTRRTRTVSSRHTRRVSSAKAKDDEPEVIVRHFSQKPAQPSQAKVKEKDGVRIISEE